MARLKSVRRCAEESSEAIFRLLGLFFLSGFSLLPDLFVEITFLHLAQRSGTGMPYG
jgi:hypothetical protein